MAALLVLLMAGMLSACGREEESLPLAEEPILADDGLYSPDPTDSPEPVEEETPIVISMVGDCTLASSQYNDDFESVVGTDYSWPFAGVREILESDDFTIANLEGSFSDRPLSAATTFYFRAPSSYAQILKEGSVECATMGNNHTGEFGKEGIRDTKDALDAVEVSHLTSGEGTVYDVRGMKLGVYVTAFGPGESEVRSGVRSLQDQGADLIIVCIHWGVEGSYRTTASQTSVAHAAIDAGADVVCGTHPHVLQKLEEYGDGYIFYSLGNFSFGGNTNPRDRDTVIAQILVEQTAQGDYEVSGVNLIPCCLSSKSSGNNYQPVPYAVDSKEYDRTLSKLDGTFDGPDLVVDYSHLTGSQDESDTPTELPDSNMEDSSLDVEEPVTTTPDSPTENGDAEVAEDVPAEQPSAEPDVPAESVPIPEPMGESTE